MMEAKRLEAEPRQEAELRQEAALKQPKVETTEEGEESGTGALEEEEARDKDKEENGYEGLMISGEDIDRPNEYAE